MRILSVHNFYVYSGGEDVCRDAELRLLRDHGHEVDIYDDHNDRISEMGKVSLALRTVWSRESYRAIRERIRSGRHQVMHVTNYCPLISPSAYYAAAAEGAAVVQSLHNYRQVCPGGLLLRNDRTCELCKTRAFKWPGVRYACYRGSRAASATVAGMLWAHRVAGTWTRAVDAFIALTPFARDVFIEGGLPADRIHVKPNFVHPDPGQGPAGGAFGMYVGRLSPEKGLQPLLSAWRGLSHPIPLRIVGDGPLRSELERAAADLPTVSLLGAVPRERVHELLQQARFLVLPSTCYEGLPMTIVEAFAAGTAVIVPNHGGMAGLVDHRRTGLQVAPGDEADWQRQLQWATDHPAEMATMGGAARTEYEAQFTAASNLSQLEAIYRAAIDRRQKNAP